ncbi:zinc-dependent alcohol dehydrogenase family protein [Modicisalibacter luteus]|uniref:Zinc-dependent alcohol dehydrogenase family protein n=1 Tax=Modicisalibacter luteus TaxID=453962 RepID=A0ABV7M2R9_9GAMM|nr:zinc-dependent alcohol dehydrogenase family protein [Halomonas lutea]GHB08917.1 alcohol dehydrogenase [Halomonas lutea]
MPRVIRFHQFGTADVLRCEEQPEIAPGEGEVLVSTEAIGVNWFDVLWRQNLAPSHASLPSRIGHEMAGTVLAVGNGVEDLAVGDSVASFPGHDPGQYGTYADRLVLPRCSLTRYPSILSPIEASVHYSPLFVAYFGLVELAKVRPQQWVLITAASQTGGPYTIQLAKALGTRVIATTRFADDRDYLLSLGAEHVIVTEEQDLVMQVAKLTDKRGVNVVMDPLGGPQMGLMGDVLAPQGRLVLYGLLGGNETPLPACEAFRKNIQFHLHCLTNFTGKPELGIPQDCDAVRRALETIDRLTNERRLLPQIDRVFPFEEVVEAHRYHEKLCPRRGRVVLKV